MRHVFRASSAIVLFSGVATAQTPPPNQPEQLPTAPPDFTFVPQNFSTSSDITRGTALQLTRDRELDAVILVDGHPNVVYAPSSFGVSYPLPVTETVQDVTSIAGIGLNGLDALIYVSASGVHALRENSVEGNYDLLPIATSANYQGCQVIRTGFDATSGANQQVYVLGADKRTIRSLSIHASSLAPGGSVGFGPTVTSLRDVRDFTPVYWDTDAVEELALLTTSGVEIYSLSGVRLAGFRDADWMGTAVFGDVLVRLRIASLGRDRLAWISKKSTTGNEQTLWTLDVTGFEPPVDLGTDVVATACAVDDDLDGDDDLFLSLSSSHVVKIMTNFASTPAIAQGGGPKTFSTATGAVFSHELMSNPTPFPSNHAWPIAGDFAGDGDVDVLAPVFDLGGCALRRNQVIDASEFVPRLMQWFPWINESGNPLAPEIPAHSNLIPSAPPADPEMTHVELTVWHRSSSTTAYETIANQRRRATLATAYSTGIRIDFLDPNFFGTASYACVMRFVKTDASGNILRAGPSRVFAIMSESEANTTSTNTGIPITTTYEHFLAGPIYGHVTSGGQIPVPQVTPLPPDPPRPGDP